MLYRDLKNAGYTVFFDHETLGAGNFISNIQNAIDDSTDFLLLLSRDALSKRIFEDDDILHKEIAYALKKESRLLELCYQVLSHFLRCCLKIL